jgi:hypothetical protein
VSLRPHPEHAILGVKRDPAAGCEEVRHASRLADPKVDV